MPSKANAADRPTRLDTKMRDIQLGSEWQDGMPYLKLPFCDWPWERNFAHLKVSDAVPREELVSKYRGVSGAIKLDKTKTKMMEKFQENYIKRRFDDGYITNDYDKLIDKTEPFFRLIAKVRARKKTGQIKLSSRDHAIRYWFKVSMPATRLALEL